MTRHPNTGQLIESEADWKDEKGEWLPVHRTDQKDAGGNIIESTYKPIKPDAQKDRPSEEGE